MDQFPQDICVIKVLRLLVYETLFVIRTIEQLMEMIVVRDTDICQICKNSKITYLSEAPFSCTPLG
jgi:hypothetical protein